MTVLSMVYLVVCFFMIASCLFYFSYHKKFKKCVEFSKQHNLTILGYQPTFNFSFMSHAEMFRKLLKKNNLANENTEQKIMLEQASLHLKIALGLSMLCLMTCLFILIVGAINL